jgi:hypothetical protein
VGKLEATIKLAIMILGAKKNILLVGSLMRIADNYT